MPIIKGRAQAPPQLLEEEEFLQVVSAFEGDKVTFESPDRLPADINPIETRSTAEGLLRSWLKRSDEEKEQLLNTPTEAFYLRPPHITKSKKSLQLKKS